MADGHQHAANDHRAALAEHAVGEQAAEDRREIGKAGVEAEQLRGERLHIERPEQRFEPPFDRAKPEHGFGLSRLQEMLDHVENDERAVAEIGEALPHLAREQDGKPARMAEQIVRRSATME